jgi:hypothetical protein
MADLKGMKGRWVAYADRDEPIVAVFGQVISNEVNMSFYGDLTVEATYIRARWTHVEERTGEITLDALNIFEKREDALLHLFKSLFEDYT